MSSNRTRELTGLLVLVVFSGLAVAFGLINSAQAQSSNSTATTNSTSATNSTTGSTVKVSIVPNASTLGKKAFDPNPVTVPVGGTVVWTNNDTVLHTVTSGTGSNDTTMGKAFDSGLTGATVLKSKGSTFSHTFKTAGNFSYFCQVHPTMQGQVIVSSSATAVTPEFPTAGLILPIAAASVIAAVIYASRSGFLRKLP